MSIAAVPAYLGKDFNSAPPGHRFTLYLEAWRDDFTLDKNNKAQAVKRALPLPDAGKALEALRARQLALADALKAEIFDATATAPFATGLGMEHPLENGFAFLNPYGLPYLPGSGVKGVLRAAARELCPESEGGKFDSDAGWTQDKVRALFGGDPGKEPFSRGALTFWDVIPTLPGNTMRVDVMTPHQPHYYQNGATPHDSGQPNPIPFLTVPPGAEFRFIVTCEEKYLKGGPLQNGAWKVLLKAAFMHAYEWLGFGAKTAVGYGAMARDSKAESRREAERQERQAEERKGAEAAERAAQLAAMSPVDRKIAEAIAAKQPGQSDDSAVFNALKGGSFDASEIREAAAKLKAMMQSARSWKETTAAKKPEKDKEHQRTLQVMQWLKD
ncbi:MAG: type III-B CRISPR module RAMP protein Cmr6 [Pseudomonadota bacterium]